jgi:hypothetical protein
VKPLFPISKWFADYTSLGAPRLESNHIVTMAVLLFHVSSQKTASLTIAGMCLS